ncbi:MAG TPA: RNA methyltransferase [Mycobacteriales bacterium]|nr:RNA methyltransferase [Mycobacteriales bacterium]
MTRPGELPYPERTPRVAAARRLTRRAGRTEAGLFLAEGPQAVREAVGWTGGPPGLAGPGPAVVELLGTPAALERYADLVRAAERRGVPVLAVTERGMAGLSETVTPQGLVAVCRFVDVPLRTALRPAPRLVVLLAAIRDPGNAGTVLRTADAAGAGAVLFSAESVDPYNGKCVRASAGSLFHLPVVRGVDVPAAVPALRAAGLAVLAAAGDGETDLEELADAGGLARPVAWLFGNEAHGLPAGLAGLADARVRIPLHGRAESLNLAAAAAICLYATARAQRADRHRQPDGQHTPG